MIFSLFDDIIIEKEKSPMSIGRKILMIITIVVTLAAAVANGIFGGLFIKVLTAPEEGVALTLLVFLPLWIAVGIPLFLTSSILSFVSFKKVSKLMIICFAVAAISVAFAWGALKYFSNEQNQAFYQAVSLISGHIPLGAI